MSMSVIDVCVTPAIADEQRDRTELLERVVLLADMRIGARAADAFVLKHESSIFRSFILP